MTELQNGLQFETIPISNAENGDFKNSDYPSIYIAVLLGVHEFDCDVCSGMVLVDIPEFAPLRKSWIQVVSFLEELVRSNRVSKGSPLNQSCETRLGPFGTGLERQLDEFPVCRTLGLAIHSFSAIGCFSAVSCFSAARSVRDLVRFGIGTVHVPSRVLSPGFRRHVRRLHTYWIGSPV